MKPGLLLLGVMGLCGCETGSLPASAPPEPPPVDDRPTVEIRDYPPGPVAMRRLTRSQYIATIQGIFGADLEVLSPTEVDSRIEGLRTVGASDASITPAGFERYEAAARQVAADVFSADRRATLLDCEPADRTQPDDACAGQFVDRLAPLILRRPLFEGEASAYVAVARSAADQLGDFDLGLQAVLSAWLLTPDFLFIQEQVEASEAESAPLTSLSLASRLSYFLWHQAPDADLLAAAADGSLNTDEGYAAQVDRLLADAPRLEQGVRALFIDLYDLDALDTVEKDLTAFPQFSSRAIEDAREQTLRTIVDHLLVKRRDYRDLFTTRDTMITRNLGPLYDVPAAEGWHPYTFPENSARAGILSHASFLALQARAARSSPVLRGLFVLDNLLCSPIPPPPADVNFEAIAPENGAGDTARERLAVHRADPTCAACHDSIDPIGLALENFDAVGQFRLAENDAPIDSSGNLFGQPFADVREFYEVLRNSPLLTRCVVDKLFMHAVGREKTNDERAVLRAIERDFEAADFDFISLLKTIALSHSFRASIGPRVAMETTDVR